MKARLYYTKKNALYGILSQILNIVLSFVSRTLFIKYLGSEYLGLNGLFTNVLSMLSLAELGVGGAITYSLYKPIAEADEDKINLLMKLYKKAYLAIGLVIAFVGVLLIPALPMLVKFDEGVDINYSVIYILFLADTVSTYLFSAYRRSVLQAGQQEYIVTNITSAINWLTTILQIALLIVTKNYYAYLLIKIILGVIRNEIISFIAGRRYPCINRKTSKKVKKEELISIGKNIYALAISKISSVIYYSSDNIVISSILGTVLVGYYSNYYMIVYSVTSVIGIVLGSAKASIGNLNVCESNDNKLLIFNRIQYINYIGYGFSAVCLAQLLSPFISLWIGKEYVLGKYVVYTIVLNFLICGLLHTVTIFKDACGLFWQTRYRTMATAIVNVVVSIVLAHFLGLAGVFLGTIISYLVTILPKDPVVLFGEIFQVSAKEFYYWYFKSFSSTLAIYAVIHTVCSAIPIKGWGNFFIMTSITIVLTVVLFLLFTRKTEEYKYFRNLLFNSFMKKR